MKSPDVLLESFNKLYDNGYRFISSLDEFQIVEKMGYSEITTSVTHLKFTQQGKRINWEEKKRMFNYMAFLISIVNVK